MKYGESIFDILYLTFAIVSGCVITFGAKNRNGRLMGLSALILGCGDAFHLIPRVMNYFTDRDMTAALGVGKLITSITMTFFYLFLYYIWLGYYNKTKSKGMAVSIWIFAAIRVVVCLFPQNGWLNNSGDMTWAIIRNIPFVALGAALCLLYFRTRNEKERLKRIWLYILLSFAFYIPVAVGAGIIPILGMLMLPKTVCYVLMILTFVSVVFKDSKQVNSR